MPVSLLTLPREIRDMIYTHILVSPSGYITAVLQKDHSKFPQPPTGQFNTTTSLSPLFPPPRTPRHRPNNLILLPCDPITGAILSNTTGALNHKFPLTSRQIHAETNHLLWSRNTLVLPYSELAIQVLKHMGQKPSRHIQSVHLQVSETDFMIESLTKALRMLGSRARQGELRNFRIVLLDGSHTWRWKVAPGRGVVPREQFAPTWLIVAFLTMDAEMTRRGWEKVKKEVVEVTDHEAISCSEAWQSVACKEYLVG